MRPGATKAVRFCKELAVPPLFGTERATGLDDIALTAELSWRVRRLWVPRGSPRAANSLRIALRFARPSSWPSGNVRQSRRNRREFRCAPISSAWTRFRQSPFRFPCAARRSPCLRLLPQHVRTSGQAELCGQPFHSWSEEWLQEKRTAKAPYIPATST